MVGVKAALKRTICAGWPAPTMQKPRAPSRRSVSPGH